MTYEPSVLDFAACVTSSNVNGNYYWTDTAADVAAGSFDLVTAQELVGLTLVALATAFTFRFLRDMITNRR